MEIKVVPLGIHITRNETQEDVANQLEAQIVPYINEGWEFVRLETVETNVAPTSGCFGFGAQPGYTTSYQVLVFKK